MKDLLLTDFFPQKSSHSSEKDQKSSNKTPTVKTKPRQTYLNLGQQDFFNTCPKCQMTFNPDEPTDLDLHKKYHNFCTKGISIPPNHSKYVPLSTQIASTSGNLFLNCQLGDPSVLKKNLEIIQFINIELGCSFMQLDKKKSTLYSAIILVNEKRFVIGYLLYKSINYAYKYDSTEMQGEFVELDVKIEAKLGISILWISPGARRKGLGLKMLETVLQIHPNISKSEVAFSQPTKAGRCLFLNFIGPSNPLLVYLEE